MALKQESNQALENSGFHVGYTGIGLVNATMNLTQMIKDLQPDRVINLGTAGSFSVKQGQFIEVEKCIQRGKVISLIHKMINLKTISDYQKAVCGSADFVETKVSEMYQIMDMETHALALVCENFKIPFHSFKYVTDSSDHNTMSDWKKNLILAQEQFLIFCKSLNKGK